MLSLSPSTQERNLYADKSHEEANMNKLADDVMLKIKPISVVRNDRAKDANAAIRLANQKRVRLHVSLHTNAGGGSGVEVFYNPAKPKSKTLAEKLSASLAKAMGLPNRGIKDGSKTGAGFIEVRGARKDMDAVLVELFFHDNKDDLKKYRANYAKVVNEIAWRLKVYFGVK